MIRVVGSIPSPSETSRISCMASFKLSCTVLFLSLAAPWTHAGLLLRNLI